MGFFRELYLVAEPYLVFLPQRKKLLKYALPPVVAIVSLAGVVVARQYGGKEIPAMRVDPEEIVKGVVGEQGTDLYWKKSRAANLGKTGVLFAILGFLGSLMAIRRRPGGVGRGRPGMR